MCSTHISLHLLLDLGSHVLVGIFRILISEILDDRSGETLTETLPPGRLGNVDPIGVLMADHKSNTDGTLRHRGAP
jgi:hypothetical protein